MGDGDGKWIRFEDGLKGSDNLREKSADANEKSYKEFRGQCVDRKLAKERRVILIFLGVNSDKGKSRKKRKSGQLYQDEKSVRGLLIESIMDSRTLREDGKGDFFTVAAIKCEDPILEDAAYAKRNEGEVQEYTGDEGADSIKGLSDGGRIVACCKVSRWKQLWIGGEKSGNKDRDKANSRMKQWLSIGIAILSQHWWPIISILYGVTDYLKNKLFTLYDYVILPSCILYYVIYNHYKRVREEGRGQIANERKYFRNLNYPIIFYNETGKTKGWMINYIQGYLNEGGIESRKPIFYIGAGDFGNVDKNANFYQFTIPIGHPEWGLICLCKLVRDLADNPWGEVWSGSDIIDRSERPVFSPALEADRIHDNFDQEVRIFKIPEHESDLRRQIEEKKMEQWNFARNPSREDAASTLFPIGNSVYVIRKNINKDVFYREIIALQPNIWMQTGVYGGAIKCQFWLIQVNETEREIIDDLSVISSQESWDERHDLWKGIWDKIDQLLQQLENPQNIKILCDNVRDEKKHDDYYIMSDLKKLRDKYKGQQITENMYQVMEHEEPTLTKTKGY